jgi:hypothetical protein
MANRYFNVKISSGTAPGPYNIYYDQVNVNNLTTRTFTNQPATNVSYTDLTVGEGVNVFFPDTALRLYVYNIQCNTAYVFTLPPYSCDVDYSITEIFQPDLVDVTYEIYKLNPEATGYITDGPLITQRYQKTTKSVLWNSDLSITGVSTNSSIFVGWSFEKGPNALLQTNPVFLHSVQTPATYYAIIDKLLPVEKKFCKYATTAPQSIICPSCDTVVTVYFNRTQYETLGINNITWYKDRALTTVVDNGYYKEYFSEQLSTTDRPLIYRLVSGIIPLSGKGLPEFTICCDCNIIECLDGEGGGGFAP